MIYILYLFYHLLLNIDLINLFIKYLYMRNCLFESIYTIYIGCDCVTDNDLPCTHHHK